MYVEKYYSAQLVTLLVQVKSIVIVDSNVYTVCTKTYKYTYTHTQWTWKHIVEHRSVFCLFVIDLSQCKHLNKLNKKLLRLILFKSVYLNFAKFTCLLNLYTVVVSQPRSNSPTQKFTQNFNISIFSLTYFPEIPNSLLTILI